MANTITVNYKGNDLSSIFRIYDAFGSNQCVIEGDVPLGLMSPADFVNQAFNQAQVTVNGHSGRVIQGSEIKNVNSAGPFPIRALVTI